MKLLLERVTIGVIVGGLVMLMQPFSLALYGWSFTAILAGTVGFMVVGKLPL